MRKGFTLIELLAVIVILAAIALIATPIILGIIENVKKEAFKNTAYGIISAAKNEYLKEMYSNQTTTDITFTYANNEESPSVTGKSLNYSGEKPKDGTVLLSSNGDVAIAIHNGTYCAYKSYSDSEVVVDEEALSGCITEYSASKGVNVPKLVKGMTPIKWDGSKWIETTISDKDWYDYTTKKWANAKTADGSMWVWIPRYIYRVTSGWHSNTTGTIEIKFSKGIDDTLGGAEVLDTRSIAEASNAVIGHASYNGGKYTNHPGFTFGTTELTGIWVAKFEPTATEGISSSPSSCNALDNSTIKTIKIIPNATSWRCITIGNAFTNVRNMEANAVYGWPVASGLQANASFTTDTNNINTHLMKNIEWGIVAYLSKSNYGQGTNEIWINPANNFTTGCAGNSTSSSSTVGCLNAYNTTNGQKASTTRNIYGVYDISGGSWEYVAAYANNGNGNLSQGSSIISATSQYKDVYTVTTDDQATNYSNSASKKGDALYETSNASVGLTSWFSDYSSMPYSIGPWFMRSGLFSNDSDTGAFIFNDTWGGINSNYSYRPVLVVNAGL